MMKQSIQSSPWAPKGHLCRRCGHVSAPAKLLPDPPAFELEDAVSIDVARNASYVGLEVGNKYEMCCAIKSLTSCSLDMVCETFMICPCSSSNKLSS